MFLRLKFQPLPSFDSLISNLIFAVWYSIGGGGDVGCDDDGSVEVVVDLALQRIGDI